MFVKFYVEHYNRLIVDKPVTDPSIIPDTWYRYTREDVDPQTKQTAIKNAISEWIKWETSTITKLQQSQLDLYDDGEVASAMLINEFISDVADELKCAKQMSLNLMTVDYDLGYILGKQDSLYDKYKDMIY